MNSSINKINRELKAIADAHLQINTYYWGDFASAINEQVVNYPLMCCYYTGNSMASNTVPITLNIVICDKFFKDGRQGNLNDTESDTIQVARDIYTTIKQSPRWNDIGRVDSASFTKFMEKGADETAGGILTMNFTIKDNQSICDLPMLGYDFESQSEMQVCADVIIVNSDATFTYVATSGETYILPDTSYTVYVNSHLNSTFTVPTLS